MKRAVVGGLSTHGKYLLESYQQEYFPSIRLDYVDGQTVRREMINLNKHDDAVMIILGDNLYKMCIGLCDRVLAKKKTYRYRDDDTFEQFLISKYGVLASQKDYYEMKLARLLAERAC